MTNKVFVRFGSTRNTVMCDDSYTISQVLEQAGVNAAGYVVSLNGYQVTASDLNRTLASFGNSEERMLFGVENKNNA